jgi:hypothetical protein
VADPIRFFAPEHPELPRTLRDALQLRIRELGEQITGGYASDWADYRRRVGHLNGLRDAMAICAQLEKEFGE